MVDRYRAMVGSPPGGSLVVMANVSPRLEDRGGETFSHSISIMVLATLSKAHMATTRPYSFDDLIQTMTEADGEDMRPFFNRYVDGTDVLPLADYLTRAGLQISGSSAGYHIARRADASAQSRSILHAMLHR